MTADNPSDLPPRVRQLIDMKRIRRQDSGRGEALILWQKAMASAQDAQLAGISLDGGLRAAYDAALNGCQAILAMRGLRTASGQGHHEVTFSAVEALGLAGLADLVPDSEEIRSLRKGSVYDPILATEADRRKALDWMLSVLPHMRSALAAWDPSLDKELPAVPVFR